MVQKTEPVESSDGPSAAPYLQHEFNSEEYRTRVVFGGIFPQGFTQDIFHKNPLGLYKKLRWKGQK